VGNGILSIEECLSFMLLCFEETQKRRQIHSAVYAGVSSRQKWKL
jgi:hypothetical protein